MSAKARGGASRAWSRLWGLVRPSRPDDHPNASGRLGEYAAHQRQFGAAAAEREFPDVAEHLARGCALCSADLQATLALLASDV